MIIDAHYHLDPKMETVEQLLGQMAKHQIDRLALIAAYAEPFHLSPMDEKLSWMLRKALAGSLNKAGLFFYKNTVTKSGKFSILGKTYPIYLMPDNESVAQVIRAHPDKFYGWIAVNPKVENPSIQIEKYFGQPGWIGVKSHPFWSQFPVSALDDAAAFCVEKNVPLLIHLGGDKERGDYRFLPERHPNLKLIYAHAGVPFYRTLWKYIQTKQNVFIDLSSPYLDEPLRLAAIKTLGAQKCIYGTDGPYGYPAKDDGIYDHGAIINEIIRAPISDADKELILYRNFQTLALPS